MIHEFGIEPELAATWGHPADFRHFVRAFGLGTPRVVSRFPKDWKRLVWDASQTSTEMEKKRLEELIFRFAESMVRRGGTYEPARAWIQNAIADNHRSPFAAILARTGTTQGPVVGIDHIADAPAWKCPAGITCPRTAEAIGSALSPLLRICRQVAFVDPHFGPSNARHRRPLAAFLEELLSQRPGNAPDEVLVLSSIARGGTTAFFASECRKLLPSVIPSGLRVVFRRLKEVSGKERLHNRYVLTDVGGVLFGFGLDDGEPGENDDLSVLSSEQLTLRRQQYLGPSMEFDVPDEDVIVVGVA